MNDSNTKPVPNAELQLSWSDQQRTALDRIEKWRARGDGSPFYLAGYAGTGKTTLANEIGSRAGRVVFASYTGKAASVMRKKGCKDASTIHSLIYTPHVEISCVANPPCADPQSCKMACPSRLGWTLDEDSSITDAKLVIIDECSMVDEPMGKDLLSFGVPVLVLGDPGQLPPIHGHGYFTGREPDFFLTEVHRQALGSPVIQLATAARAGRLLREGKYGDSAVLPSMLIEDALAFDQIIVGTHKRRYRSNEKIRRELGYSGATPNIGEKLICLKNDKQAGLFNGTFWTVTGFGSLPPEDGFIGLEIKDDTGYRVEVKAPLAGFGRTDGNGGTLPGQPFDFGYAITCHKAQGSQWNSVLVTDESFVFRADRFRWLYTAITRAAERVTVVAP